MADETWLPVPDAARALGVSEAAVRSRLKRRTLRSRRGNDGVVAVLIVDEDRSMDYRAVDGPVRVADRPKTESAHRPENGRPVDRTIQGGPSPHHDVVGILQDQLTAAERRHEAEIGRLVAQFAAERSFWTERADAAELRAERAEQMALDALTHAADTAEKITAAMVEAANRPVWRRWFG